MKRKGLIMVLVCVMALSVIVVTSAQATTWYTCSILRVGNSMGNNFLLASETGGAFTARWLTVDKTLGGDKEMLATMLTAISSGSTVSMYIDDSTNVVYSALVIQ
ncbi:MAG: hypothetical protein ACYDIC_07085 [Desulfobaccales bacterium]